jgi:hypothetical protein
MNRAAGTIIFVLVLGLGIVFLVGGLLSQRITAPVQAVEAKPAPPPAPVRPEWEYSGVGAVVIVNYHEQSFAFETDDNWQKLYGPLCTLQFPVWQGEHMEFSYRWAQHYFHLNGDEQYGCYEIARIHHLPPDWEVRK